MAKTNFGTMDKQRHREVSSRGGVVATERTRAGISQANRFTSDTGRRAAQKRYAKGGNGNGQR